MTTEFALLLALAGVGLLWLGRTHHDRRVDDPAVWDNPPAWLRAVARRGPGPLRPSAAFEIYGAGLGVLGVASAVTGTNATLVNLFLAAWFLGGIAAIGLVDSVVSIRAWLVRRGRREAN